MTSNFNQTFAQVLVKIHGIPQEYWRLRIFFAIVSDMGTPICIDSTSSKSTLDHYFGHFVWVLVEVDLHKDLKLQDFSRQCRIYFL